LGIWAGFCDGLRVRAKSVGVLTPQGVSGLTDACTHVGGDGDGTDFRLSRNGDGAVPVAAHSLREWREAMVRWFAYLGLPATPMLARMFAWVGCDPIFDCRETEMGPRNSHLETLKENADCR
jgi:hypothetical protein